jgi:hypothetical protein
VLVFALMIFGGGVVIQIFRTYMVNYIYILDIDPRDRIREHDLFKMSLGLMIIWFLALIGQLSIIKNYVNFNLDLFAVFLVVSVILIIFHPFDFFYREMRYGIFKGIITQFLAPLNKMCF